jgi:hypothetical protein
MCKKNWLIKMKNFAVNKNLLWSDLLCFICSDFATNQLSPNSSAHEVSSKCMFAEENTREGYPFHLKSLFGLFLLHAIRQLVSCSIHGSR